MFNELTGFTVHLNELELWKPAETQVILNFCPLHFVYQTYLIHNNRLDAKQNLLQYCVWFFNNFHIKKNITYLNYIHQYFW